MVNNLPSYSNFKFENLIPEDYRKLNKIPPNMTPRRVNLPRV